MSLHVYDGTIFPGSLGGRFPRIGRILPKACYKDSQISRTLPDRALMEQHVAIAVVALNGGRMPDKLYVEQIDEPWFNWGLAPDQQVLDMRAGFMQVLRRAVGPGVELMYYAWPLGSVMQACNWVVPGYFDIWVKPAIQALSRARVDQMPDSGTVRSALMEVMDAIGISLYWDTDTSKLMPRMTEAQAYWTCCEPQLELAHSFGKPVYCFVRIMAPAGEPPNGIPVPQEVINLYYKFQQPRGAGQAMVIWEAYGWDAKGPPLDAPGMKAYGKLPGAPAK